jgi:acetylornithine deacetylase/succinyl-diaminopimelate desuccinylase-like protein
MSLAETIDAFLAEHLADEVAFLAELVKVPSDNPPGDCAAHAARAQELLEALDLAVEAYPVDAADVLAVGMTSATNLVVRHRFGDGPTIALNAHGDVVPPGLGWHHDPYGAEIEDDAAHGPTMYGRGVAVSKSDFATYTFALLALREAAAAGASIGGTVELHFTYDEEAGGEIGPKWLLDQNLTRPDYAIGAGFAYNIVSAHNGCLHLEVVVTGRQAHAAMPETGLDALEAATGILAALYDSRPGLAATRSLIPGIGSPKMNVGLIAGGINTNVVPDRVTFRLDRRIVPEEDPTEVEAGLRRLIAAAAAARPGISVEVRRVLLAEPLVPVPGWERIAEALQDSAEAVMALRPPVGGVPLYTDARHYAARGIPIVLYGAGPRTLLEANGHNADENLRLGDLHMATRVIAHALAELGHG